MVQKTAKSPDKSGKTPGKPTSLRKSRRSPKNSKDTDPDKEPVLSGRLVIALALFLGMSLLPASGLGRFIEKQSPKTAARSTWKVGETSKVLITVVTSDYGRMACADSRSVGKNHCEFKSEKERWKAEDPSEPLDDNKRHVLQPYRTTDKSLILAAGFWAQPEVAMRAHHEPSRNVNARKLARFVASCDVKFIDKWEKPAIRWNIGQKWAREDAVIGEIQSCHILEDNKK